jgi:hypothetical protein
LDYFKDFLHPRQAGFAGLAKCRRPFSWRCSREQIDPSAGSGGLRQDETSMRKAGARTIDATWKPRSTTSRRKNAQTISGTQDMRHQNPDLDEIWSFVYAKQKNIRRQTLPQKTLAMFGHGLRSTPIARLFHRGVLANGVQKPGLLL